MEDKVLKFYLRLNYLGEQLKAISDELRQLNASFIDEIVSECLKSIEPIEYD